MTATLLKMPPRHRMTQDEFNKRLAALGPNKQQATTRWEHGLAELFYESEWTQAEIGQQLNLSARRVGQLVAFGLWLETENGTDCSVLESVTEGLFRKCWLQTKPKGKNARADDLTRCLLVTPLIEKELARPKVQKIKVTPSKTEKATLESLVKPGRWKDAKALIDDMARAEAEKLSKSMQGFYQKQIAKSEAAEAEYKRLSLKLNQIMTQTEYRMILGCLHPDRQTEAERKKYDRAFEIFSRVGKSITWN